MFSALRTVNELYGASPSSSTLPTTTTSTTEQKLQRGVFSLLSSGEQHLTSLYEEAEKNGGSEFLIKGGDSKAAERRLTDFITHAVQTHLRSVTYQAALVASCHQKQAEEDHREDGLHVDHSLFMGSDADAAQLLWMNRTLALGATISALEGKRRNIQPSCVEKVQVQEKSVSPNYQMTIRHLRNSFSALRCVLIYREKHLTKAATDVAQACHRRNNKETRAKRLRTNVEEAGEVEAPRLKKPPFSFAVKIDADLVFSQPNDRAAAASAISSWGNCDSKTNGSGRGNGLQMPQEEQVNQQQQQQQRWQEKNDVLSKSGIPLQSSTEAMSQMKLNVDGCGKFSLVQAQSSLLPSSNSMFSSSSFASGNAAQRQQQSSPFFSNSTQTFSGGFRCKTGAAESRGWNSTAPYKGHEHEKGEVTAAAGGKGGHQGGGFITANEQLAADVRAGRALPSSLPTQRRTPALGLRRSGFVSPFQQQQQQRRQQASPPPPSIGNDGHSGPSSVIPVGDVLSSVHKNSARGARDGHGTVRNRDDSDSEQGEYPASLLLPDGTVPPILRPLDPKLVAQVAMEILEHGAGAANVGWDDIAGLEHAKRSVEEAIVWPLRRPDLFVGLRDPPRGLLLFGPPGTGKTMIARAIANRAQCTFLNISASSLMSKWMGEGEKLVRCLFSVAVVKQPSVIFIDEIDSLLSMRGEGEMDSVRRVKTEFLVQLDGVATDRGDRILLIGATNRPEELDEAARRRMEKRLYIPLPDVSARVELIKRLLQTMEVQQRPENGQNANEEKKQNVDYVIHALDEKEIAEIAAATDGYSGADMKQVCREAAMGPLREVTTRLKDVSLGELRPIQRKDFMQALKRIRPSVGASEVKRYIEWNKHFGSFSLQEEDEFEAEIENEVTTQHAEARR